MSVPYPGLAAIVAVGGTPVTAAPAGITGGIISNPLSSTDQGLPNSEPLYIDPVGAGTQLGAGGTSFALQPGDSWTMIPGQTTVTNVNAASSGHRFTVVYWI